MSDTKVFNCMQCGVEFDWDGYFTGQICSQCAEEKEQLFLSNEV